MTEAPPECTLCSCQKWAHACPQGVHESHPMEPAGDSGYWFCPAHDVPSDAVRFYWLFYRAS